MISEGEWKAQAELVGQVMLSWSRNTHQLPRVFTHITGLGSPIAETVFLDMSQMRVSAKCCSTLQRRRTFTELYLSRPPLAH